VLWSHIVGGNDHYYDLVVPVGGITWTNAKVAAENTIFHGVNGHLATIADLAEWDFVIGTFPRDYTWIGLTDEAHEGVFEWVTGEPLTFTRWIPGEPNNAGNENYVFYQHASALGGAFGWNDFRDESIVYTGTLPIGYVVEFNTVPEPSGISLAGGGMALCVGYQLRRRQRHASP